MCFLRLTNVKQPNVHTRKRRTLTMQRCFYFFCIVQRSYLKVHYFWVFQTLITTFGSDIEKIKTICTVNVFFIVWKFDCLAWTTAGEVLTIPLQNSFCHVLQWHRHNIICQCIGCGRTEWLYSIFHSTYTCMRKSTKALEK